jgi:hypothetical protein
MAIMKENKTSTSTKKLPDRLCMSKESSDKATWRRLGNKDTQNSRIHLTANLTITLMLSKSMKAAGMCVHKDGCMCEHLASYRMMQETAHTHLRNKFRDGFDESIQHNSLWETRIIWYGIVAVDFPPQRDWVMWVHYWAKA